MGMKFFPQEVERVLQSHPGVEAACVCGHPGDRRGEQVFARVVIKQGCGNDTLERQLRQHCQERLAAYKVPGRIEFVSALPRTASGKVLHRAL